MINGLIATSDGGTMLQRGDLVPHFTVKTLHGDEFSYLTIWQRRNLVLIALPVTDSESARSYASELAARGAEFSASEADCVITQDRIQAIPGPAVLVADQWGEVVYVAAASDVRDLPQVEEVLEWVHYVQTRCPECEGESK
jgi:peroxiredoxin